MASKLIVFLGLLLAMVLLISSEVVARELAESSNTVDTSSNEAEKTDDAAVNDAKYPGDGYGGYPGGGYGSGPGGYGGGRGGYGAKFRCYNGCCQRNWAGCRRCCTYAGEKPDAEPQTKPQNQSKKPGK